MSSTQVMTRARSNVFIHGLAWVHDDCKIGEGTLVWQFASVIRKARLGDDCKVAANSIVDGAWLGDRVAVGHCAFVSPGTRIERDVFIGPGAKFCNDPWPWVGKDQWFSIEDLIEGKFVVTHILEGASVGAGAVVMPGITIGEGAMVAAGAIVRRDVPDRYLLRVDGQVEPIRPQGGDARMRFVEKCST